MTDTTRLDLSARHGWCVVRKLCEARIVYNSLSRKARQDFVIVFGPGCGLYMRDDTEDEKSPGFPVTEAEVLQFCGIVFGDAAELALMGGIDDKTGFFLVHLLGRRRLRAIEAGRG